MAEIDDDIIFFGDHENTNPGLFLIIGFVLFPVIYSFYGNFSVLRFFPVSSIAFFFD